MFKRRFTAALALSGMTRRQWAEQHGVCYQSLQFFLDGRMASKRLTSEAECFIDRVFREHLTLSTPSKEGNRAT